MRLVSEPFSKRAIELTDGDTSFRDFNFNVIAPTVGIAGGGSNGTRLCLECCQFPQKFARHDLARLTTSSKLRRHRECLNYQPIVVRCRPYGRRCKACYGNTYAQGRQA